MSRVITISTGTRLHFGPLSYLPQQGRHFGGVGVMIDEPGYRLQVCTAQRDTVLPEGPAAVRVWEFVQRYRRACPDHAQPPACRVTIEQDVPSHSGLGSGTQLGLAVARALSELAGERNISVPQLARRVGRGRRSAVGIYGFDAGGLIVEAGRLPTEDLGALSCRMSLPDKWRVLLIVPHGGNPGLSGAGEDSAFRKLGPMSSALTERLCRLVLMELLPAVQSGSFDEFGGAVHEYGRLVGEFFAPVQGGVFGHPRTDALIERLRELGIQGAGQTSWGPTVFAFVPDAESGVDAAARLADQADVCVVRFRNAGARIEWQGDA